ncbi:MAG TPA: protein translocase subunit SecD [Solirubrobacteraceae bacterium]|nr:protein translocase subunit SecD [Solirubrobacteraceae bacterium]
MSDRKRHGFVLLIVAGLLAGSIIALFTAKTELGLDLRGGVQLVYQASGTPAHPRVTQADLNKAVTIMQARVNAIGVNQPSIETSGGNQIQVALPAVHDVGRAERIVGSTSRLLFYDWEANAITPNGKTVASQLLAQNPAAMLISQGPLGTGAAVGSPGSGSMGLYAAVKLASKQPPAPYNATTKQYLSRKGPELFLFGAPGSAACQTIASREHFKPIAGEHCFIAGGPGIGTRQQLQQNITSTPATRGISISGNELLTIPQGWVVLQAVPTKASATTESQLSPGYPSQQFFVLHDHVALTGAEITNPQASTDSAGQPDVTFGFTPKGSRAFQNVTMAIAHRGRNLQLGSRHNFQHFAAALDTNLLTVPQIDYTQYPDGIVNTGGSGGSEITGGFTTQSAEDLATQLRLGALPINLHLISENQVSATLGAQALHDGVLAGGVGLIIVILFLIAYYRVLGLIATSTLLIYAVYFYALIKLIPIVLTLAGIAGLILTIGVAADANIVIFERVKEEIRAGRSVRAGIVTGYKKGLSAIIDANVVTIMTAFILFVLSTQQVQGFAFTLGIGTVVSLFTAVLATQAILTTAGDTRTLARPSALGAGKPRRSWRFDYMGASRYFFTMSGVILLIGALAIGGRGLKLGIDFTSGSQITQKVTHPATIGEVRKLADSIKGVQNATVEKVGKGASHTFQIAFKGNPQQAHAVRGVIAQHLGGNPNSANVTSVGPTFGASVTHAAIIAIIASLLVISAYVALRFQWKFAVPVLIALAHDILITAGVYALTGRQVTVDTVAALLTILGYSLYDTIIVFDRVRENIPRMPRAAFSQIVNRSMSEVITRSLATTTCTLLPILALLFFGGSELSDFAFALLIGVASGAYSSIFIASPVLTHWKEREPLYRHRRARIETDNGGLVPAYAPTGSDVAPRERARRRRSVGLAAGDTGSVSAAEFEQMKRDIMEEEIEPSGRTSMLTRRAAHTDEEALEEERPARRAGRRPRAARQTGPEAAAPKTDGPDAVEPSAENVDETGFEHAPDEVENEGMLPNDPRNPRNRRGARSSRRRGRGHGRR